MWPARLAMKTPAPPVAMTPSKVQHYGRAEKVHGQDGPRVGLHWRQAGGMDDGGDGPDLCA
jgi:hypothetical protein